MSIDRHWKHRARTDAPGTLVWQSIDVDQFRSCLAASGYDPEEPPDYPGGVLFHGQTTELFPAGALGSVRIHHPDGIISAIHFFDPVRQDEIAAVEALVIDRMSEREISNERAWWISSHISATSRSSSTPRCRSVPMRARSMPAVAAGSNAAASARLPICSRTGRARTPPPPQACDLIDMARIGLDCRALGIARLDVGTDGIAARLRPSASAKPGSQRTDSARSRLVYKHKIDRNPMLQAAIRLLAALKRNGMPDRDGASPARGGPPGMS